MVLGLAAALSACKKDLPPTEALTEQLDAIKDKNYDEMQKGFSDYIEPFEERLPDMFGENVELKKDQQAVFKDFTDKLMSFDYEIKAEDISEDGKTAVLTVEFTTYDFGSMYSTIVDDVLKDFADGVRSGLVNEKNVSAYMIGITVDELKAKLGALKDKTKVTTATINMELSEEGDWIISEDQDKSVYDAMFGGLLTAVESKSDSLKN
jgi:hypothetical protein